MSVKVVKFGGSSLADAGQIKKAAAIIKSDENRRFVVPSAPGKRFKEDIKVTDMLYACYEKAALGEDFTADFDNIKKRYNDIIADLGLDLSLEKQFEQIRNNLAHAGREYAASRGEYLNGIVIAAYLGYTFIDAADVIVFSDEGVMQRHETVAKLRERLANEEHAIIPGFYGKSYSGVVRTFSRGGSDVTGSLVARAVHASVYENWTDVSGILVADPRVVDSPVVIPVITYKELRELSYMGFSVLHEDAIFPVRTAGIPINIRNTNAPEDDGTMIVPDSETGDDAALRTLTGIAGKKGFCAINMEKGMMNSEVGFVRDVLNVFADLDINVEHMPSGIDTLSIIADAKSLEGKEEQLLSELRKAVEPDHLEIEPDIALLAVVGRGMRKTRGTAARIFASLAHGRINVKMIDQGSSELNVIIGVNENDLHQAIRCIYDAFISSTQES
ncbi:MAG: aspartate kinase [Oscillospiraceae bacterium]|nr:aspartate kinase [Oscillospiraceae bacterium]